ncbi:MAG TPA: hypothetical protein VFX17_02995 [Patescibacteria group bacterium]|nr:hypothetical protein [Patescibacteria group bacterium]
MIDYAKIFKQALHLLAGNKFFWGLGLFLAWGSVVNQLSYQLDWNDSASHLSAPQDNFIWLALAGIVVIVILVMMFFRCRTAIILATKARMENKPTGFGQSFRQARVFYDRVFGVAFYTMLILLAAGIILFGPVLYLHSVNLSGRAAILGILALVIVVPLAIIASLINNLAPMFIVFYNMKIREAVSITFDMIKKSWPVLLVFSIWLAIIATAAEYILVLIWDSWVVFSRPLFYNAGGFHLSIVSAALGAIMIIALIILTGAIAAYQQICWTLLFSEMVRPEKIEEKEVLPASEAVQGG